MPPKVSGGIATPKCANFSCILPDEQEFAPFYSLWQFAHRTRPFRKALLTKCLFCCWKYPSAFCGYQFILGYRTLFVIQTTQSQSGKNRLIIPVYSTHPLCFYCSEFTALLLQSFLALWAGDRFFLSRNIYILWIAQGLG